MKNPFNKNDIRRAQEHNLNKILEERKRTGYKPTPEKVKSLGATLNLINDKSKKRFFKSFGGRK